ncbi:dihydropteroate synthase [Wenxinia saemankumensis]|uniref:Dihydropteroate synthase n=1 Tax=Wenxinia saemankumensis TaxID=1447782 RepID=A0A1M6GXS6_9RHOB|nr:dihydropteroate synthase [Wenxinia saemankumensis]SHJ14717.1 Dihydropteroate synthase [Wenxinia saemankumensis]
MSRLQPIPSAAATEGGLPLAGSARIRFSQVLRDGRAVPVSELDSAERRRLSARRPDLCGLPLDRPRIMGILNVTPDSFSDGGDLSPQGALIARAREMAGAADILDIGGESTRPGAAEVGTDEEIARVVPAIRAIRAEGIVTPISVDTRKARVAAAALEAGADLVNDVSALSFDPEMGRVVAGARCPIVLMHARGTPADMDARAVYGDVVEEVFDELSRRIDAALDAGVAEDRLIVDPGIGFGKNLQQNVAVLRALARYHALGPALLSAVSRKRFIGTIGQAPDAKSRGPGSIAVALWSVDQGAQIVRVHDAAETRQALRLHEAMSGTGEIDA